MHSDLDVRLRNNYPELTSFNIEGKSTRPLEFGCGDGWFSILVEVLGLLDDTRIRNHGDIQLEQIKQKFGRLEIYFSCYGFKFGSLEYMIFDALCAYFSLRTCEICGSSGRRRRENGLFIALCDHHHVDWKNIESGLNENLETLVDWRDYRRCGLETKGKFYMETDAKDAPEGKIRLILYAFQDHIVSVRNEPIYRQLKIIRDEIVDIDEAYNQFMAFRRDDRLINYYWSIELRRFHNQLNGLA